MVQARAQVRLWNPDVGESDVGVVRTKLQGVSRATWSCEKTWAVRTAKPDLERGTFDQVQGLVLYLARQNLLQLFCITLRSRKI